MLNRQLIYFIKRMLVSAVTTAMYMAFNQIEYKMRGRRYKSEAKQIGNYTHQYKQLMKPQDKPRPPIKLDRPNAYLRDQFRK